MSNPASLNDKERARVAEIVACVKRDIPIAIPLIRELHEAGLIQGWRAVVYCGERRTPAGSVCGPFPTGRELTKGQ